MNKFKQEFAQTMETLRGAMKIKWAIGVILTVIMTIIGICGGNYHTVARITIYYFVLIVFESIAVGVWTLCRACTNQTK